MTADWQSNKCGGIAWRTLPNHAIELQGIGVPEYAPGSASYQQLERTWRNFQFRIRAAASSAGLPNSYVLAIATKETGLWSADPAKQATIGSSAGAQGVMQIMPCKVVKLACGVDRSSPTESLRLGARLLASHVRSFGSFPPAASAYNAGGLRCYDGATANAAVVPNAFGFLNEHDYATAAVMFNNTAIKYLGVNAPIVPWIVGGALVAATGLYFLARHG